MAGDVHDIKSRGRREAAPTRNSAAGGRAAHIEAMERQTAAIVALTKRVGPAADTIAGFGDRLDGLCLWMKKRGPWLLASVPLVLLAIKSINPDLAAILAKLWAASQGLAL